MRTYLFTIATCIGICLLSIACSDQSITATPIPTDTIELANQIPTLTFTPTTLPSPTLTATPTSTPLPPTATNTSTPTLTPTPRATISVDNATKLVPIARYGTGVPNDLSLAPNGVLAVGSSIGIYLFDTATFEQISFMGTESDVLSVAFSPDGDNIAFTTFDGSLFIYDDDLKTETHKIELNLGYPRISLFTVNATIVISGWQGNGSIIKQLSLLDGSEWLISSSTTYFNRAMTSRDGRFLVNLRSDGLVTVWDLNEKQVVKQFSNNPNKGITQEVAISPDGTYIAMGYLSSRAISADSRIEVLNISDWQIVNIFSSPSLIEGIAFSPDNSKLGASFSNGSISWWNIESTDPLGSIHPHKYTINRLLFSNNDLLISASLDGTVKFFNANNSNEIKSLFSPSGAATCVAFAPDGRTVAVGFVSGIIKLWDTLTGRELLILEPRNRAEFVSFSGLSFAPDGKTLASSSSDGLLRLWDTSSGTEVAVFPNGRAPSVAFSPDGNFISAITNNMDLGKITVEARIWDVQNKIMSSFWIVFVDYEGSTSGQGDVAFSPDGIYLATASSDDRNVRLWDLETQSEQRTFTGSADGIVNLDFSPDGTMLGAVSNDQRIRIWNTTSGQLLTSISDDLANSGNISFSPDGRMIGFSTGSTIALWDVAANQKLQVLTGPTFRITDLSFSPDGRLLASVSWDGTVVLWGLTQ